MPYRLAWIALEVGKLLVLAAALATLLIVMVP